MRRLRPVSVTVIVDEAHHRLVFADGFDMVPECVASETVSADIIS